MLAQITKLQFDDLYAYLKKVLWGRVEAQGISIGRQGPWVCAVGQGRGTGNIAHNCAWGVRAYLFPGMFMGRVSHHDTTHLPCIKNTMTTSQRHVPQTSEDDDAGVSDEDLSKYVLGRIGEPDPELTPTMTLSLILS